MQTVPPGLLEGGGRGCGYNVTELQRNREDFKECHPRCVKTEGNNYAWI